MSRRILLLSLGVLYLLHNDLWWWDDPSLVFGLPVGLGYHVGFCVVASFVLALLVRYAPPAGLRSESVEAESFEGKEIADREPGR